MSRLCHYTSCVLIIFLCDLYLWEDVLRPHHEGVQLVSPETECGGPQAIDSLSQGNTSSGHRVLLIAMALGKAYLEEYNQVMRTVHQRYAARHGYDFKVVTRNIGNSTDILSFPKALLVTLPCAKTYDFLVYVDGDVWIRKDAPPIHLAIDFEDKVGLVDEYAQPTPVLRKLYQRERNYHDRSAEEYYRLAGFTLNTTLVLNTGVMVLQPRKHRALFERIYNRHFTSHHSRGKHFEQSAIGYELQVSGLFKLLPSDWNGIWALHSFFNKRLTPSDFVKRHSFSHFTSRRSFGPEVQMQLLKNGL